MRKKVMSWARSGNAASPAAPSAPAMADLRLIIHLLPVPPIKHALTSGAISTASIHAHHPAQGRPDLGMNHQVGIAVLVGRVSVHDHQAGPLALGDAREACRGIDDERAA